MRTNRARLLAEVVSLDAWYSAFVPERNCSEVFVELTFKEGRLGGDEADFPFTFKLSLRRARLTVSLESPLQILRSTVARNVPDSNVHQTRLRAVRDNLEGSVGAKAGLNQDTFLAALSARLKAEKNFKREEETSLVQILPPILAVSEPKGEGEYSWTLEPTFLPVLKGQPWNPTAAPRLSARYDYQQIGSIDPVIQARIDCAFEDLAIEDIQVKDQGVRGVISMLKPYDTRLAAAKQHIKHVLTEADLFPGALDNRFSSVLIASVIAASEQQ